MKNDPTLWFLVHKKSNHPIKLVQAGITIGPYIFSSKKLAEEALEADVWPEEAKAYLAAKRGSYESFMEQLAQGLPPAMPDIISLNATPFDLFGGLYPITEIGAIYVSEVQGTEFWTQMKPGELQAMAAEATRIAVGLSYVH